MTQIRLLGPHDAEVLARVAADVFDDPIRADWSTEFLADPRHHLLVALETETRTVVGFASGVHYLHPDKPPELFINEVAVAPAQRSQGLGKKLLRALLEHARALGCREAWVATEPSNTAARRLYGSGGGLEAPEPCALYTFALGDEDS